MHVRFTTLLGMPVTVDQTEEDIGMVTGILIHPDTAVVEGFFVQAPTFWHTGRLFLASADILHLGSRMRIRSEEKLGPVEELIRVSSLLEDGRSILHQRIVTESGMLLGRCADVQLETKTFQVLWLFPRKWFRWQRPVSVATILEVREDDIIVKDPLIPLKESTTTESVFQALDPLATPVTRVARRQE